jgi:hypothetical protein
MRSTSGIFKLMPRQVAPSRRVGFAFFKKGGYDKREGNAVPRAGRLSSCGADALESPETSRRSMW